MKKLFALLLAAGCLTAFQAKADLVSAAPKAQNKIDSATATVENTKASVADAQTEATQKAEAKKQAVRDKVAAKKAEVQAKKKEIRNKIEAKKAENEAKKAEQKKAVEDTRNSINNLKNAFTK